MKFKHTYCFYMTNGEHLMIDADDMTICDDFIKTHREKDGDEIFMVIYKKDLMAWGGGQIMSDIYEICEDCKYATFYSEDPGYSPKECGLPSRCITYLDGCKKDLEPFYNNDAECVDCEAFEPRSEWE